MAGVRKRRYKDGRFRGWYLAEGPDGQKRQRFFTGTRDRRETLKLAQEKEAAAWRAGLGLEEPRASKAGLPFADVTAQYFAWGHDQGGRGGRPWSAGHARMVEARLNFWAERLSLTRVADLDGRLADVEAALRALAEGHSPKTCREYAGVLHAFGEWATARSFYKANPLSGLRTAKAEPQGKRRALAPEELTRLLRAAPDPRRLVYLTAVFSGFRANELRSLRVRHLHAARGLLDYEAAWSKARKAGQQPIAPGLARTLARSARAKADEAPLLEVPSHTARELDKDLEAAQIEKHASAGKLDFHSLRVAFATLCDRAGASAKELQELLRHAPANLGMRTYAKVSDERLHCLAGRVWTLIMGETYAVDMPAAPLPNAGGALSQGERGTSDELATAGTRVQFPPPPP